jgi:hypothetical protein
MPFAKTWSILTTPTQIAAVVATQYGGHRRDRLGHARDDLDTAAFIDETPPRTRTTTS